MDSLDEPDYRHELLEHVAFKTPGGGLRARQQLLVQAKVTELTFGAHQE